MAGTPVLNWQADNLMVEQDAAGNLKPSKAKSRQRIDGMVALVMALSRLMLRSNKPSRYEERSDGDMQLWTSEELFERRSTTPATLTDGGLPASEPVRVRSRRKLRWVIRQPRGRSSLNEL